MSSFPFQAVAFDLDDTLLRDDLTISSRTISVLREVSSRGARIIPVSGRAQLSMRPFVEKIACASLYISCNGAEIWTPDHALLSRESFSPELGREIAAFGKGYRVYAQTYEGPHFYYNEESDWAIRYAASSMLTGVCVGDLERFIQEPRQKILMMAEEEKIASMLRDARQQFDGRVSVTCSKPWFLEFNPIGATKGLALAKAAALLDFEMRRTLAFGDSLNDLSMLQACGRGVLMANGRPDLRSRCDDVCGTNQEDGVGEYLEHILQEVKA